MTQQYTTLIFYTFWTRVVAQYSATGNEKVPEVNQYCIGRVEKNGLGMRVLNTSPSVGQIAEFLRSASVSTTSAILDCIVRDGNYAASKR
jgi:hypothetical protein